MSESLSSTMPADALRAGASFALEKSKTMCSRECRSYHGVWLFTRLFGVLPAVQQDRKLFGRAIANAAKSGLRRILISGAADFGILELVVECYREADFVPQITVLDLCDTPLAVNRWYGEKFGWQIDTIKGNILEMPSGRYDLILAHNFLNFFAADEHEALFARWSSLLEHTGQLILVNNIKPGAPVQARRFGESGTELLIERMLEARERLGHESLISAKEIEALLRDFARRRVSWNISNIDVLHSNIAKAGLTVRSTEESPFPKNRVHGDHTGRRIVIVASKDN